MSFPADMGRGRRKGQANVCQHKGHFLNEAQPDSANKVLYLLKHGKCFQKQSQFLYAGKIHISIQRIQTEWKQHSKIQMECPVERSSHFKQQYSRWLQWKLREVEQRSPPSWQESVWVTARLLGLDPRSLTPILSALVSDSYTKCSGNLCLACGPWTQCGGGLSECFKAAPFMPDLGKSTTLGASVIALLGWEL